MADDVTFTLNADSTPPAGTVAATDETTAGPHAGGSHMGIAKLAVSADGDSTHLPATVADGLLVNLGGNNDVTITGSVTTAPGTTILVADNLANPTIEQVLSYLVAYDGAQWDRVRTVSGLADNTVSALGVGVYAYNGAGFDRVRGETVNGLDVDVTRLPSSGTATRTTVADTASDTQLLASNTSRKSYSVTNDSTAILYLGNGAAAASTTSYSVQVPPNSFYSSENYTGEVRGIWATDPGTGAARITEYT